MEPISYTGRQNVTTEPPGKPKRVRDLSIYEMERAMATHSSTLAWKIPWTEKPGGLQSMGSLGVRHD